MNDEGYRVYDIVEVLLDMIIVMVCGKKSEVYNYTVIFVNPPPLYLPNPSFCHQF